MEVPGSLFLLFLQMETAPDTNNTDTEKPIVP